MVARTPQSLAAFAVVAASIVGAPLQARSYQQPVTVLGHLDALTRVVPIGDLALTTGVGRKALMYRVSEAVGQVCPDFEAGRSVYDHAYDIEDCKAFAWSGADPQIRRAIDSARSGQAVAMAIEVTGARL